MPDAEAIATGLSGRGPRSSRPGTEGEEELGKRRGWRWRGTDAARYSLVGRAPLARLVCCTELEAGVVCQRHGSYKAVTEEPDSPRLHAGRPRVLSSPCCAHRGLLHLALPCVRGCVCANVTNADGRGDSACESYFEGDFFCYVEPGVCPDGGASSVMPAYFWSEVACDGAMSPAGASWIVSGPLALMLGCLLWSRCHSPVFCAPTSVSSERLVRTEAFAWSPFATFRVSLHAGPSVLVVDRFPGERQGGSRGSD